MKIDCSITENYLKERYRMEKSLIGRELNEGYTVSRDIESMQAWSDAHPQKTYLEDLLEKYPKIKVNKNGYPGICAKSLGYTNYCDVSTMCRDCQKQIMEDKK